MIRAALIIIGVCVLGVAAYMHRIHSSEHSIAQKKRIVNENSSKGFAVKFKVDGGIVEQRNVNLGTNVFVNPEIAAIFHKCASRAMVAETC